MSSSYKSAGVDLEKYEESMARLPAHLEKTFSARVIKNPGGFAGLFRLNDQNREYKDPVLVSGTDGVGTKLKVASATQCHDTIGVDLVAMCVNDVICCGAEPLFFLDYVAMGQDDPDLLDKIVSGIGEGCSQAGCALIGGETAIMPDMYQPGDYDVAGFCVGVVEREQLLDGSRVRSGDKLLGVASSGLHSNGYSLVRNIVFGQAGLDVDSPVEELGATVGNVLMQPTIIYADLVKKIRNHPQLANSLHGLAHITGGGLTENVSRILPTSIELEIQKGSWDVPPVFEWLKKLGDVESSEMDRVFNMGIGLVMLVDASACDELAREIAQAGYRCFEIGSCVSQND